jgi:type IV pilus assembly protein PilA
LAGLFVAVGVGCKGNPTLVSRSQQGDYAVSSVLIQPARGFTFVELLVVFAAVFVMLAGAQSWLANYSVRSKLAEALSDAEPVKFEIVLACNERPDIEDLTSANLGIAPPTSLYVESVTVGGSCNGPHISVQTANTGLLVDPTFILAQNLETEGARWTCSSTALDVHTPIGCYSK